LRGKNPRDGGLLHRLDYETAGLLLIARTQSAFDSLCRQQDEGGFIKGYTALAAPAAEKLPGFPPCPYRLAPARIESAFRAWGPGRKAVRPLPGGSPVYATYIKDVRLMAGAAFGAPAEVAIVSAELRRGFRHQIRCHLAWLGFPLLNDPVYCGAKTAGLFLGLRADRLEFADPESGERQTVTLE
jgi:23S rRNA pseudouridine1911/1915/1917 synthase